MIAAISAGAEHSRHHPERPSVRKLNKRTVASTDNLLDPLPPPDERLHEGLVEKRIATGASVGHWEPRHALVSKDSFLLSRPTVHESVQALLGHFTSGDVAHCFAMADRDSSGGLSLSEWENAFGHIVTTQVLQQLFVIFTISRPNWKSADFRGGKSQESGRTGRAWLRSCVLARVGAYDVQVNDVNVFFCCCHCRVFRCVPGRSPV